MYLYETHLHTAPISACAKAEIRETLEYYKSLGYAGVFLTNHFLDGNIEHSVRGLPKSIVGLIILYALQVATTTLPRKKHFSVVWHVKHP